MIRLDVSRKVSYPFGLPSAQLILIDELSVCSDEGLMLETSAKHHIPQAQNITISTYVDQTHIQRTRSRRKFSLAVFIKQTIR